MRETAEASGPRKAAGDKASRSLSIAALLFVALAAVMGWGASFVGLHEYGMQSMAGFSYWSAWLVPATFDGAAFACTLMTYRSSINGRSALRGRILMWAFTAVSSWINWIHQPSPQAQIVAAGLPIAAVAVFDVVLLELRADYEARHGKRGFRLRPGLLVLRWMVDRTSTRDAFRKQVIDIPVEEIAGLGPVGHPAADQDELEYHDAVATDHLHASREPSNVSRNGRTPAQEDGRTPALRADYAPAAGVVANGSRNGHTPSTGEASTTEAPAEPEPATTPKPVSTPKPASKSASTSEDAVPTAPARVRAETVDQRTERIPVEFVSAAAHSSERMEDRPGPSEDAAGQAAEATEAESEERADDSAEQPTDPSDAQPIEAAHSTEQTVTLPPIPERPMTDEEKRAAARQDYRLSLETSHPANGAQLGKRYGMSARWGRNQIAAVRDEMRREQHPRLVAVDGH